jgi:hypothetical protein
LLTTSCCWALSSVETNWALTKVFRIINSSFKGTFATTLLWACFSYSVIKEAGISSQVSDPRMWPFFMRLSYQVWIC